MNSARVAVRTTVNVMNPHDPESNRHGASSNAGFTLVELLVTLAIVAVLATLSLLLTRLAMARADHAKCLGNLQQILTATVVASTDSNGKFPVMELTNGPWMQDVLWPYLNGDATKPSNVLVTRSVFTCPAAQKNPKQKWLKDGVQYRYNSFTAPNKIPVVDYSTAVVIFDKQWGDWRPTDWSHFPGPNPTVNIGYADGHIAATPYAQYHKLCSWGGSVESYCPIYQKGWKE